MSTGDSGPLRPDSQEHPRLGPGEERLLAQHLLEGCESCLAHTAELHYASGRSGSALPPEPPQEDYSEVVAESVRLSLGARRQLELERDGALQLREELMRFAPERRQIVICNSAKFHNLPLCELLVRESESYWFSSPAESRELAELAVAVAETIEAREHNPRVISDLRARSWAYLGNANRILSDFRTAEGNFRNAREHLAEGTGSPTEEALLREFQIALRLAQKRFAEAEAEVDEVARIYRQIGDTHLLGRILIRKGNCRIQREDREAAARFLRQGLRLVDRRRDPRLYLGARHNLVYCLIEEGQLEEACECLESLRSQFAELGDSLTLTRLRWLEGKIALKSGDLEAAEAHLSATREELQRAGIGYDTALVCLDLARVYAEQGRSHELRLLAAAMVPIFQSRDIHEEALAALVLFHQAAEAEAVTLSLLGQLTAYLERAQSDPNLKFRSS